jgi:hypothetical protein
MWAVATEKKTKERRKRNRKRGGRRKGRRTRIGGGEEERRRRKKAEKTWQKQPRYATEAVTQNLIIRCHDSGFYCLAR